MQTEYIPAFSASHSSWVGPLGASYTNKCGWCENIHSNIPQFYEFALYNCM